MGEIGEQWVRGAEDGCEGWIIGEIGGQWGVRSGQWVQEANDGCKGQTMGATSRGWVRGVNNGCMEW